MALIALVAEGPSEQQFITNNLAPYLQQASGGELFTQAIVVKTSVTANGKARFWGWWLVFQGRGLRLVDTDAVGTAAMAGSVNDD